MEISDTQYLSISEKYTQVAEARHRKSEQALTQASGIELGVAKEEIKDPAMAEEASPDFDSALLSASAMARYRAAESSGPGSEESFSRQAHDMDQKSRAALYQQLLKARQAEREK